MTYEYSESNLVQNKAEKKKQVRVGKIKGRQVELAHRFGWRGSGDWAEVGRGFRSDPSQCRGTHDQAHGARAPPGETKPRWLRSQSKAQSYTAISVSEVEPPTRSQRTMTQCEAVGSVLNSNCSGCFLNVVPKCRAVPKCRQMASHQQENQ